MGADAEKNVAQARMAFQASVLGRQLLGDEAPGGSGHHNRLGRDKRTLVNVNGVQQHGSKHEMLSASPSLRVCLINVAGIMLETTTLRAIGNGLSSPHGGLLAKPSRPA